MNASDFWRHWALAPYVHQKRDMFVLCCAGNDIDSLRLMVYCIAIKDWCFGVAWCLIPNKDLVLSVYDIYNFWDKTAIKSSTLL